MNLSDTLFNKIVSYKTKRAIRTKLYIAALTDIEVFKMLHCRIPKNENFVYDEQKIKRNIIQEEERCIKNLLNQITLLEQLKKNNHKSLNLKLSEKNVKEKNNQDLIVAYIINITFSKTNTTVHISDAKGNVKFFYSAGSVKLTGKQKTKRRVTISKLITLLLKKATFLKQNPIALHLNNVNFYRNLIVSKLQQKLYIRVVKSFNQSPYNGCRKKKVRRKKHTKKFK